MRKTWLYLITKLQNLKAIHNWSGMASASMVVVSNYKITKSESYSQPSAPDVSTLVGCI